MNKLASYKLILVYVVLVSIFCIIRVWTIFGIDEREIITAISISFLFIHSFFGFIFLWNCIMSWQTFNISILFEFGWCEIKWKYVKNVKLVSWHGNDSTELLYLENIEIQIIMVQLFVEKFIHSKVDDYIYRFWNNQF